MKTRWLVLSVVLVAAVMDLLDATVMNVAAPTVRAALGGGEATVQWMTAGYTLAFGVLLVIGGRLGDRWGRRRLFLIGAIGFTLASVACAAAVSPAMLVTARVVQGALGALMIPQGFGVLTAVFTDARQRGRAFSLFGPVSGLAGIGGPILAGVLIAWDLGGLGWQLVFLLNVPLGVFAVLGALAWMPADRGDRTARLDPVGAVLVAAGSAVVVLPLIQGREAGWPWWTFALLAAGLVAFALVAVRQRTSASPIVAPALLRRRPFVAGLAVAVVFFAGTGGLMLVLSLFLQLGLHYSALHAGLALAPVAAGIAVSSLLAPALAIRLGRALLHLGLGVELLGTAGLAIAVGTGAPASALAATTLGIGLGLGLLFGPLIQRILTVAAPDEVGSAAGTLNAAQQIATALGVAVLGTVFFAAGGPGAGLVAGALIVATSCVCCAALVFLLPRTATA
ncbi:MFS transporter [Actinoplanes sp. NPDC048967]|uniref:MFS transporter n=1 Tax=Actinoplanes sp. NPDC048967 TaxID=3155269 RepID=UPI0033DC1487